MNILKIIIRIGIGVFFIASAILKLISIDNFELYIYSFNIFSFTMSGLAARAIIACELLVGILLIAKIKYKEAWWLTMLMLVGFSFLLVYVILFRNDSNCHCMGDLVEIKPSLSLIKNLLVIALMLLIRKEEDYRFRGRVTVLVIAILTAIAVPFALFPMDNIYNLFSKTSTKSCNEAEFNSFLQDSVMQDIHLDEGNYIVGVVSSGCKFCRIGCLKMSEMVTFNKIDSTKVLYFIWGDSTSVQQFREETKSEPFLYVPINPVKAIRITDGAFPLFLFIRDGEVQRTADLRQLTEKEVVAHLK
ncbi:MAG: DoxX family membrane protein [Bacteroidales bacterium]|nr:DoxX family membrane protein [Bacteroidales bacterium]